MMISNNTSRNIIEQPVHVKNRILFKNNKKILMKYPHIHDEQFQKKITLKKEFQFKYDGEVKDILEEDKKGTLCNQKEFLLNPHQHFVKSFINDDTPYNGVLLYHGMGSGKTCSAIGITEEYRKRNKYNLEKKKIIIVASPNVQKNFLLQLFDQDKLFKSNGSWKLEGCVGSSLLQELYKYDINHMDKDKLVSKIKSLISRNYNFMGYEKFSNKINSLVNFDVSDNSKKKKLITRVLNKYFKDSMIVIDEVHNIRMNNDTDDKKVAESVKLLVKNVKNMKLIFLSGTPMYNDPREIIFLLNLLIMNDKYMPISTKDIFRKDGSFIVSNNGEEIGKKRLIERANGYISFVRGENPYNFPFKIYPNEYNTTLSIKSKSYPKFQFNGKKIIEGIQHMDIFVDNIGSVQKLGYEYILDKIYDSMESQTQESFANMDSFGYNILKEPLNALNICYEFKEGDDMIYLTGKDALPRLMTYEENKTDGIIYNYDYIGDEKFFSYQNIGKYSGKIKSILDSILNSTGIVLVYSQYLDAGLVPLALALEELGFGRLKHMNLLKPRSDIVPLDAVSMKPANSSKTQAKYCMITGDRKYSPNNYDELRIVNEYGNITGEKCKVVLISQAGSEGIDFKCLRQVHIMEPWYNLNRIEQITGRAIRNCSHKNLPLMERNCQIFLHGTMDDSDSEYIDMMVYRYAERKASRIGNVQKVLKSVSVDCILNYEQTNFSKYLDQVIPIKLSTGEKLKINIKDKPYSSVCDYSDSCTYKCVNSVNNDETIDTLSYSISHLVNHNIVDKIKNLFIKRNYYKVKEITKLLVSRTVSEENIDYALEYLLNTRQTIIDFQLRKGNLVSVGDIILFKPLQLSKELTSLYDLKRPIKEIINSLNFIVKRQDKTIEDDIQNSFPLDKNISKKLSMKDIIARKKEERLKKNTKKSEKINIILKNILEKYSVINVEDDMLEIKSDDNFYTSFRKIVDVFNNSLHDIKLNKDILRKLMIQHILETLDFNEEIILVEYLIVNKDKLSEFEIELYKYYEQFLHTNNDITLLFLVDLQKKVQKGKSKKSTKIPTLIYTVNNKLGERSITESTILEKNTFGMQSIEQNITLPIDITPNEYMTYMSFYDKDNSIIIKFKDQNGSGSFFRNKQPQQIILLLNEVFGTEVIKRDKRRALINGTEYTMSVHDWCIFLEILMRYYTIIQKDNKVYHLNKVLMTNLI
jgi:hypothetical protein